MNTGIIGLGAMGMPMARNLAKAGLLTAVWNRTQAKAQALVAELAADAGVAVAATPAELAARCEVIVTCVSADADVLAVVDALLPAIRPSAIVIDTSTVGADTARAAADRLAQVKAAFLDAPVSGGVEGAKAGTLAIMVGGEAAAFERARPVLDALGTRVVHMGAVGAGQATKAVNQIMAAGINQAVTEALAFAQAMRLPLDKVIDVVGGGAAGNWLLNKRGPTMIEGRYDPGFKLALHHKDLTICKQMAARLGVQLPIVEMTLLHYQRLMNAGHGDEDISALFRQKRQLFEHH